MEDDFVFSFQEGFVFVIVSAIWNFGIDLLFLSELQDIFKDIKLSKILIEVVNSIVSQGY